ncbi:hypothetical protein PMG11_03117 [Penicillium brasilianum]|uniref:Uncharacterized protein n=1 Tax=Penicillium brasilianum TaxID=104259 RepID=A0A0F7V913_PENBI|nr:hypothetical protein PMG11_03117 [Penicillium brasilianum]
MAPASSLVLLLSLIPYCNGADDYVFVGDLAAPIPRWTTSVQNLTQRVTKPLWTSSKTRIGY